MKIAYLPIDERPCNVDMVQRIADSSSDIELVTPGLQLLGKKKAPADTKKLWEWIQSEVPNVDALIISMDMLLYGGLLPSRLHHMTYEQGEVWMDRLRKLRAEHPYVPIYASNVIMRTPKYDS